MYRQGRALKLIIAKVRDELTDLREEGIISSSVFGRKRTVHAIASAAALADTHVCLMLNPTMMVGLFVAPGQSVVSPHEEPDPEWFENFDDHPDGENLETIDFMVSGFEFVDIRSPASTTASSYKYYPNGTVKPIGEWPFLDTVAYNEKRGSGQNGLFYDVHANRIYLTKKAEDTLFLSFRAEVSPQPIDISDKSEEELLKFKSVAPDYGQDWAFQRTMIELLSARACKAGGYYELELKAERESRDKMPGEATSVYIPEGPSNYDFN